MRYLVFGVLSCILASSASATTYSYVGTINRMGSYLLGPDSDFIVLNGFASAGICPTSDGLVVARFPSGESGNRGYALAVSAKMANKQVRLAVDDAYKNSSGNCFVKSIQVSE